MHQAEQNIGVELDYIAKHLSLLGLPAADPKELTKIKHMVDTLRAIAESVQKEAQKHPSFPG